ncbi:MAG TPA: hypothetical protein VFD63_11665 [Pyrinomonadaceae bacterium]|nr:hypothetical protein [Pyrinomonadaceae bacterium]
MNQLIKQLASPTGLLYVFMVLTQIVTGVYAASGVEPPASFTLIYILGFLWIMGWWLRVDSRTRGVAWVFDMGLFLYVAWPFILPYYVLKSRGRKGLLAILCFVAVYIAATLVGVALYLVFAPRSWPVAI